MTAAPLDLLALGRVGDARIEAQRAVDAYRKQGKDGKELAVAAVLIFRFWQDKKRKPETRSGSARHQASAPVPRSTVAK